MADHRPEPLPELPTRVSGHQLARGVLISALTSNNPVERLRQLEASGDLLSWIPELATLKGVIQPKEHYWDVYEHSLQTVGAVDVVISEVDAGGVPGLEYYLAQPADGEYSRFILLKLASLLHDNAKPQTKVFEESGRMRFFGHAEQGAAVAHTVLGRLGFSARAQEMIAKMIRWHLRPGELIIGGQSPTERAVRRYFRDTGDVGIEVLLLNLADHRGARGPLLKPLEWRQHLEGTRQVIALYQAWQKAVVPPKLTDGEEIMAHFGLAPGPLVGELLSAVKAVQTRGEIASKEEALALVSRILRDGLGAHPG